MLLNLAEATGVPEATAGFVAVQAKLASATEIIAISKAKAFGLSVEVAVSHIVVGREIVARAAVRARKYR